MGWFEKIGLTPPTEKEVDKMLTAETLAEFEKEYEDAKELREAGIEGLSEIYEIADKVGLSLDDEYSKAEKNSANEILAIHLREKRAAWAQLLDMSEDTLEALGDLLGKDKKKNIEA